MLIIYEWICILLTVIVLLRLLKIINNFHCITPIIIVFDIVMVIPLIIELFIGIPDIPYPNFARAMEDYTTTIIYTSFLLIAQLAFLFEVNRIKRKSNRDRSSYQFKDILHIFVKTKYKGIIKLVCYIPFVLVIFGIVLSPDPLFYTKINSIHTIISNELYAYNRDVMKNLANLLFASVIILKLLDDDDRVKELLIRILFTIVIIFINQKRTLLMIIVGACLVIDLIKEKKIKNIFFKYLIFIGFTAFYFYAYTIITDKIAYNDDWYYELNEYIFRSMHMRFAIYAYLNPSEIHILDFPGQSIIFNLLYFIPRSLWASKPWPYIDYYISGVMGYSRVTSIGWHMPASYYPEFVSNFGLIGIPTSLLFTIWVSRLLERRALLCKMIGVALISLLEIYYYDNLLKIVAAIVFVLYLKEIINIENGRVLLVKRRHKW